MFLDQYHNVDIHDSCEALEKNLKDDYKYFPHLLSLLLGQSFFIKHSPIAFSR